ncbi:MAG: bifunctional glutamate N-acetyltransferase/amino-acid acetyltransferase ArgJ [Candidatus Saganbacteria bacterium]|nr:bifunctional glutamate N-acetyltransferase/amino-acid acetyltransferase ArgJ [Candidatus Saganbacteria bacterium]
MKKGKSTKVRINEKFKLIEGGICAPKMFLSAGTACGIKKSNKKDIALIYTPHIASAAAVFTTNKVKAAPILVSQKNIKGGKAHAVIVNSGNANACTGRQGMKDAWEMINQTAAAMKILPSHVLVASTGIIGVPLPTKNISSGIWTVSRMIKRHDPGDAAEAIMTTDTRKKSVAVELVFGKNRRVRIGGIAKGSGMICPDMATMIAVLTTDALIGPKPLQKALKEAVSDSFNMLTVDNDMSTNDCVFILANGQSEKVTTGKKFEQFVSALKYVCCCLAKEIARDGEGATKLITINVTGARSKEDARKTAKSIAGSSLFKCAVFGTDPNFGRILAAAGYSGAGIDPDRIEVDIEGVKLVKNGVPLRFDAQKAVGCLKKDKVIINVDLNQGKYSATAWGCDMTEGYIKINAHYHT